MRRKKATVQIKKTRRGKEKKREKETGTTQRQSRKKKESTKMGEKGRARSQVAVPAAQKSKKAKTMKTTFGFFSCF